MPEHYPGRDTPAHIHITVLEPNGKNYRIEEFHFENDPLLNEEEIKITKPRGGESGIVTLKFQNGILSVKRNIILGQNIPGYFR